MNTKLRNLPNRWYLDEPTQSIYTYLADHYDNDIRTWRGNWKYVGFVDCDTHGGILGSGNGDSYRNRNAVLITEQEFWEKVTGEVNHYPIC